MKINLPLHVTLPRKRTVDKKFYLNLNAYRNGHYQMLNDVKNVFKNIIFDTVKRENIDFKYTPPLEITYTIYPKNRRKFDIANVLTVVQKFADDALVELGLIEDDDYTIVDSVRYRFGEIDKDNPRVEMCVYERKGKELQGRPTEAES
jgi:Holliday junction resolvase RusA-like endonuclease